MKDRYFELKNLIGAILLLSVLVWGCTKGDQTLGLNLLPGVKVLETRYYQDKESITTSIFSDPKIRVDRPTYNLLGSFNDPLFGRTDASFAAQFRLPSHPAYSATAALDSIVLRMYYKTMYGDTLSVQNVKVYELTGGLNYNSKYLSSFNVKSLAGTEPIGTGSFTPKFRTDSTQRDTTLQIISIRLNNSFGNSLLGIDSLDMTTNDKFLSIFKGLYIGTTPISRKGALVSIITTPISNTQERSPAIILYYHDAKKDSIGAYVASANSANVSSYNHDYTLARFNPNLDKENNTDSLIYIQPTGGIRSKISIPSLSKWKDSSNYIINKATLTFHVDTIMSDYRRYAMPGRVYLKLINDLGEEEFPKDSGLSSDYYGGFYDPTTATYTFNIAQHLQQLIVGTIKNNGFYLVHPDRNNSARRVVLKGMKSSKPAELNVTYTRFK